MDEDKVVLYDYNGNLKNELVESQIRKFRGLSYLNVQGMKSLVTTEKTRHAIKLVLIDAELSNGVYK